MKRFQKQRPEVLAYRCLYPCCDDGVRNDAHEHVTGRRPEALEFNAIGIHVADALRMG